MLKGLGLHAYGLDCQQYAQWYDHPKRKPKEIIPFCEYQSLFSVADITDECGVSCCEHGNAWPSDIVICREVLEHLTIREVRQAVANLCRLSSKFVYVTTRFAQPPTSLLSVDTYDDLDPTHITMLNQDFLRTLFVLEGCRRRADLEAALDWQGKGRVLVYEVLQ